MVELLPLFVSSPATRLYGKRTISQIVSQPELFILELSSNATSHLLPNSLRELVAIIKKMILNIYILITLAFYRAQTSYHLQFAQLQRKD